MCADATTAVAEGADSEEARQDGLLATESWDNQRQETREEGTNGSDERRDHYADLADAVSFHIWLDWSADSHGCHFPRPGTSDFIAQQMQIMARMQAEQEKRNQERNQRTLGRPRQQQLNIPPVPSLP